MSTSVEPLDPDVEAGVRASFARQQLMATIGARLVRVSSGEVDIEAPFAEGLTQQHGYLHAGIVTALVDSACGYSALTVAPSDAEVLTANTRSISSRRHRASGSSRGGASCARESGSRSAPARSLRWPDRRRSRWP